MSETCIPHNDKVTTLLTGVIIVGMTISYLPQHLRIIYSGSSEGFSPWFLLLGSTSSASGMMNIIVMQWGIIKCCRVLSLGNCLESTAGIFQLSLQWLLFTIILVLYMIYYPPHLKYATIGIDMHDDMPPHQVKTTTKSNNWQLSIILSWVVLIHLLLIIFISFILLTTNPYPDPTYRNHQISMWATFLGVTSALLAALQYAPQIAHTYRMKLVGALSIKMMLIQSPGALFMVLSIALRPGTNWTSKSSRDIKSLRDAHKLLAWLPYAVAGAMQATLLIMCLLWQARQRRLGIDDFGNALLREDLPPSSVDSDHTIAADDAASGPIGDISAEPMMTPAAEDTPLIGKDNGKPTRTWFPRLFG